ncbi:GAF domain-containing protein [Streptomyces sp. NPDC047070]|uniref:GAF domain-containing protein n=1 Tax=Streptomyces sp. NPDC047070 TaxID=3154923 RepID=UPI0034567A15
MRDVQAALRRLRAVGTTAALVERAPLEINGLGYRRCLFSRLRGPDWSARSAFAHEDPWLAAELVRIGSAAPGRLGRELPETELVRLRNPILVRDAQNNPRVHRGLIDLAHTTDYIAAPLVARDEVVGLIHVDRHVPASPTPSGDTRPLINSQTAHSRPQPDQPGEPMRSEHQPPWQPGPAVRKALCAILPGLHVPGVCGVWRRSAQCPADRSCRGVPQSVVGSADGLVHAPQHRGRGVEFLGFRLP